MFISNRLLFVICILKTFLYNFRDNADKKQDCQGDCQHTSCSACRFVQESTDCVKCRKDDFSCMKRFAKCAKKRYCSKSIFPCRRKKSVRTYFIWSIIYTIPSNYPEIHHLFSAIHKSVYRCPSCVLAWHVYSALLIRLLCFKMELLIMTKTANTIISSTWRNVWSRRYSRPKLIDTRDVNRLPNWHS